jgi:NodT family efflux transporter outer membrane factor (OMF) lipoprotein
MKQPLRFLVVSGLAILALTGCTVGPDFHPPATPNVGAYTASALPGKTVHAPVPGGDSQTFAFGRDISAEWWQLFRSPELDALVRKGLEDNPSLQAAQAALQVAEENLRAAGGALIYPQVDGSLQAARQRASAAATSGHPDVFNLYNASVQVSYTLDLFGSTRRQLEALKAQVDYQQYQVEATYLTLAGNIVTTAIQEASLRSQIAATHDILAAERQQLAMVKRQFELGAVPKASVLSQQSQLAITSATLPPLEKQLAVTRHALAALVGEMPAAAKLPSFELATLHLPQELPVSLPSALARQRPDIRAAEALLHQAGANVGVATANLYPKITLSGSFGTEANRTGDLFTGPSSIWSLGAGLLQPIFHGGELKAKQRAAVASYHEAAAQYRQTLLTAFQNVADVLRALETDARALDAQSAAATAVKATLDLTQRQFDLGAVSYLSLLVAQRDYQQTRIGLITAQAQRYADTAALFQSLGGGWWNTAEAQQAK